MTKFHRTPNAVSYRQAPRRPLFARLRTVLRTPNTLVLLLLVVVGGMYLWETNRVAATGFALDDLRDQQSALIEQNRKLEIETAGLRSLATVQTSAADQGLVETQEVQYLVPVASVVASAP